MAALSLSGCAGSSRYQNALVINDAVADLIVVDELESVDEIRTDDTLSHDEITDTYIILHDRKQQHLVEFVRRCHELYENRVTPDVRTARNKIRARFDTYRGCRIRALYVISEGQAEEIRQLVEDPGK